VQIITAHQLPSLHKNISGSRPAAIFNFSKILHIFHRLDIVQNYENPHWKVPVRGHGPMLVLLRGQGLKKHYQAIVPSGDSDIQSSFGQVVPIILCPYLNRYEWTERQMHVAQSPKSLIRVWPKLHNTLISFAVCLHATTREPLNGMLWNWTWRVILKCTHA
jgi:hypothetical protein